MKNKNKTIRGSEYREQTYWGKNWTKKKIIRIELNSGGDRKKEAIQKYTFPIRAVDLWNQLPEEIMAARNIHNFKETYD